jgi:hypothetical protein
MKLAEGVRGVSKVAAPEPDSASACLNSSGRPVPRRLFPRAARTGRGTLPDDDDNDPHLRRKLVSATPS